MRTAADRDLWGQIGEVSYSTGLKGTDDRRQDNGTCENSINFDLNRFF
jgi:hypothetical protein